LGYGEQEPKVIGNRVYAVLVKHTDDILAFAQAVKARFINEKLN
jgi:hypothetical protein